MPILGITQELGFYNIFLFSFLFFFFFGHMWDHSSPTRDRTHAPLQRE